MRYLLVLISLSICILIAVYGVPLYKELTMSLQVEVQEWPTTVVDSDLKLNTIVV